MITLLTDLVAYKLHHQEEDSKAMTSSQEASLLGPIHLAASLLVARHPVAIHQIAVCQTKEGHPLIASVKAKEESEPLCRAQDSTFCKVVRLGSHPVLETSSVA